MNQTNQGTRLKKVDLRKLKNQEFPRVENMSEKWVNSFGNADENFTMIIWGQSGNGKSSLTMQLLKEIMHLDKVLYVSLEEGLTLSLQNNINRVFAEDEHCGNIRFADHTCTYDVLFEYLKGRGRERFIIIDSVQYWGIDYRQYCRLKEAYPHKTFIYISHAAGKLPDGKTADKIRYDAMIKVYVSGYVAFPKSRYGGNKPYLVWEEGAKRAYGKKLKAVLSGKADGTAKGKG